MGVGATKILQINTEKMSNSRHLNLQWKHFSLVINCRLSFCLIHYIGYT